MLFDKSTIVLKLSTALFSFRLTQATSPIAPVSGYFTYSLPSLPALVFPWQVFHHEAPLGTKPPKAKKQRKIH